MIARHLALTGIRLEIGKPKMHYLAVTASICFLYTYMLQVTVLSNATEDVDTLFEYFNAIPFSGMGILKVISLYRNNKHWDSLLNTIPIVEKELKNIEDVSSSVEYESDDEDIASSFREHTYSYTVKFQTVSTLLTRMYSITAFFYIISPFVEYALSEQKPTELPHILPGRAPLDEISFIGYIFSILVELISAIYCVCIHISFDLTSFGLMIFICGQFSLLREYSTNIGGKGKDLRLCEKRDRRAHHRIVTCHKMHIILTNAIHELSRALRNILGVYFFLATFTLCSIAVRLNSQLTGMQFVTLVQYLGATIVQLFLFCRYGDSVLHESSINVGEGPFASAYWCLSPPTRKEIAILGMGMMRPHCMYAGPFISLALPSFIQIVRTAYSYYAVIRK